MTKLIPFRPMHLTQPDTIPRPESAADTTTAWARLGQVE